MDEENTRDPTITGTLQKSGRLHGTLEKVQDVESYSGDYEVTPSATEDTVLETKGKHMNDDVTVLKIPMWETSNESGGYTVYIAGEV